MSCNKRIREVPIMEQWARIIDPYYDLKQKLYRKVLKELNRDV